MVLVAALNNTTVPEEPNDVPTRTRLIPPLVGPLVLGVTDSTVGALYENEIEVLTCPETVTSNALFKPLPAGT